ncbi:hypothetical protein MTO96_042722 [Rhipicephalus appendiculatus]
MAGPLLQFPLDLYLRMRKEGGNVLLSPWYLACMLVVMYHGSGGDTRRQIARVLCTDDDGEIVSRFDCHASRLDFSESPEQSRLALDGFLRALTGFCFNRDVFAGDSVDLDTFVVLASVFCFGSRWFVAGGASRSTGDFHPEKDSRRPGSFCERVETLSMTGRFQYAQFDENDGGAFEGIVLDLPYQDPRRSLAMFIPAQTSSLEELEKRLTAAMILTCLARLGRRGLVEVTMPRMKVKCLTDLKHYLPSMGVVDAFGDAADFVNIARIVGLRVSAAKHLAVFRSGYKGPKKSEAQAAAQDTARATSTTDVFKITVDRPFMFLVLARNPDTVLMLGSFTHA